MMKMKTIFAAALMAGTLGMSTAPAFAFSDAAGCTAAVEETTRQLLKANVANDKLAEIDALLVAATGKCASGDLEGAKADLDAAGTIIAASAQ